MEHVPQRIAVSIPELSVLTGLSEGLLYSRAGVGKLPGCRRLGKRFVVDLATFHNWLSEGSGDERKQED